MNRNVEYLSLEGPFSLGLTVLMVLLLIGLFAWSLWRERYVLGVKLTSLFFALRMVVLATVVWMLLAPTSVQITTQTTPKQVTLAIDASQSMSLVDLPGRADQARWQLASREAESSRALEAVDAAVAATGQASLELDEAVIALRSHRSESDVHRILQRVGDSLAMTTTQLDVLSEEPLPEDLRSRVLKERTAISSGQFSGFEELLVAIRKGRTPKEQSWRESLTDLQFELVQRHAQLQHLAAAVSEQASAEATADVIGPQSRYQYAMACLRQVRERLLAQVDETVDIQFAMFDDTVSPLRSEQIDRTVEADSRSESRINGTSTNLTLALEELMRTPAERASAAMFLLSDVAHNHPGTDPPGDVVQRTHSMPIYVVPIGNTNRVRDLAVQNVSAPKVAMRNDDVVIEVTLEGYELAGEKCLVELLQEGTSLDFREIALESDFVSRIVRFERQLSEIGNQTFQIAVTPLEAEATEENNYSEFDVNVTRNDLKVLLADEMPRWEYRYLTQLFRRDAKIECDELLFHPRVIATGRRAETQSLPTTAEQWDQYDVVILGDLAPEHFPASAQQSLQEYAVQRGGTVIIIAGQNAMPDQYRRQPLVDWLPVTEGPARPPSELDLAFQLTREGEDHAALMIGESTQQTKLAWEFVNQFAPLHDLSSWCIPKPSAHTLIAAVQRGHEQPTDTVSDVFLAWQPFGRGRIVYLAGPETYRLRFLRGDQLHYRFWGQLMRWAIASEMTVGSEFIRIATEKSRYTPEETVYATVKLQDAEGRPVLSEEMSLQLTSRTLERTVPLRPVDGIPGEYQAEILPLPTGVYQIEPQGPEIEPLLAMGETESRSSFTVLANRPLELADTRSNRGLATQLAEVSHGLVIPPTAIGTILQLLDLEPIVTEQTQRVPLWQRWSYLWLIVCCLGVEWSCRKWFGLS
ncbi:hypothetical protein [Rubinisphaera margarita]|uniref:hypothetical protein n=1 Tax=Rubinisphaera margarita TaxID=2909586 RepID=UPI001EE98F21|nr:hypothetical protein [Rubinisphaera margarita]MCG6155917.1 hypothetical protein [Rubinisphaera margarita]